MSPPRLFQGFFANDYAGFQQFTKVPAEIVAKIPESISYSQAASVPLALATAAIGLYWTDKGAGLNPKLDKNVQFTGQPAVVVGGASSVGQYGSFNQDSHHGNEFSDGTL
ncbi:hypothetical protein PM082_016339 [Marasmius tenuissimus]|nr:hypothetical protein PM082_016339 [Marasmius tenuissimus]